MPSDRTIRRQLTNQSSTYHSRTVLDREDEQGRHAKSSTVVGPAMPYPDQPADSPFHHDPTEPFKFTGGNRASICPSNTPSEDKADPPFDYALASDRDLQHRRSWACLIQKREVEGEAVDQAQVIIDECDREMDRRRRVAMVPL